MVYYIYMYTKDSTIHVGKYPKNDMTQNNSHPNLSAPGVLPHVGKYTKTRPHGYFVGVPSGWGFLGPHFPPGPREGLAHRGRLQRCQRKSEFGTGSLASPCWFLSEGFGPRSPSF